MKKTIIFFIIFVSVQLYSQVSFSILNNIQITPNTDDSSGVFCRTFYHPGRSKYYVVYSGRPGSSGVMEHFRWREYDAGFNYTGSNGLLSGLSHGGDFAMQMVGNYYYHITTNPPWIFKLSKYDEDFNFVSSVNITLDTCDSQADMMLDYTNGRLVVGAFRQPGVYHPSMPTQMPFWLPRLHKWEYDLNLNPVSSDTVFNQIYTPWGGSCIYNSNVYHIVTCAKATVAIDTSYKLNVYRYDSNWNYIDSIHLNNDGQWSQGVLWDGSNYYLAYHSGHEHRSGNIVVAIYDVNWQLVADTVITNNAEFIPGVSPPVFTTQYNANRPFLTKVNDTLYVSYDVDDYELNSFGPPHFYMEGNRWNANVTMLKVNGLVGVEEEKSQNELSIYPNPVQHSIFLNHDDNGDVFVYSPGGELVLTKKNHSVHQPIDLSSLSSGLYIIRLITEQGSFQSKLIKE